MNQDNAAQAAVHRGNVIDPKASTTMNQDNAAQAAVHRGNVIPLERSNTEGLSLALGGHTDEIKDLGDKLAAAFKRYQETRELLKERAGWHVDVEFAPHIRGAFAAWQEMHTR